MVEDRVVRAEHVVFGLDGAHQLLRHIGPAAVVAAGDDRGWHLRAVIKRIEAYARQPIQRIGLSATVGKARGEVRVSTS